MDHIARTSDSAALAASSSNALAAARQLKAGHAITLRAKELSVLRIAHGRVWATLTDVGPYSRVPGGDHFLSRGESLTLLPGQALVMESFGIGHAATAQFNWDGVCVAATFVSELEAQASADAKADLNGVVQPLRDLRHALGLAVGASGRLVHGLACGAIAPLKASGTNVAMIFVALRARKYGTGSTFRTSKRPAPAELGNCRLL